MPRQPKSDERCINHPDRPAWSKGLCRSCDLRDWISRQPMASCRHQDRHAYSKTTGECRDCYKLSRGIVRRNNMTANHGRGASLDFDRLLAAQGGVCGICRQSLEEAYGPGARLKHFSLDHDHVTGDRRGVLCNPCNRGLGLFKDDPTLLLAAIAYLEAHKVK